MRRALGGFALWLLALPLGAPARAQEGDGPRFAVTSLSVEYAEPHADAPRLAGLSGLEIELGETDSGYVAPRAGVPTVTRSWADLAAGELAYFHPSGLGQVAEALVGELNRRGLVGVYVAPDAGDIDLERERDLRPPGQTGLRLQIFTTRVRELRTLASGDRIPFKRRINHPAHVRLRRNSPLQPSGTGTGTDLLRQDWLEDYLFRLNRHPGRRVDGALGTSRDGEGAALDLLVNEARPWFAFARVANTGTRSTNKWRQLYGYTHYQLTSRDDILSIEYTNAGFDEVHGLRSSYEAPVLGFERLRGRASAGWNKFEASDLGVAGARFKGEEWRLSGELRANVWQRRALFVDLVGGLRWENVKTENQLAAGAEGQANFVLPTGGLRFERVTDVATILAGVMAEGNWSALAGTDEDELAQLGRLDTDAEFWVARWDAQASLYLEPLLNRAAWKDPSTPRSSTLAHELWLGTRGQYAFNYRLVPQHEMVAGGLYSVRGYPQSVVAGDTVAMGTVEYRFHLPRVLPLRPKPVSLPRFGTFRLAPQQVYGRADWDLILRLFVDGARVVKNDRISFEKNHTLLGAGAGVELQLKRNFRFRMDYGRALESVRTGDRDIGVGDDRYYFEMTVLY